MQYIDTCAEQSSEEAARCLPAFPLPRAMISARMLVHQGLIPKSRLLIAYGQGSTAATQCRFAPREAAPGQLPSRLAQPYMYAASKPFSQFDSSLAG